MDFEFAVLEFPETKIAGQKIETDMKNVKKDSAELWKSFHPRVYGELSVHQSIPEMPATYGVCKMTGDDKLTYWAAVDIDSTDKLPSDLEVLTIPMAMYVTCQVPGIGKLEKAYKAIYEQWPPTQIDYALDNDGISFERYPYQWKKDELFEVYVPVTIKEPN